MLNTNHGEKMKDTLLKTVTARFCDKMEFHEENKYFILAAVSHPLFKLEWIPDAYIEMVRLWFFEELTCQCNGTTSHNHQETVECELDFFHRYSTTNKSMAQNTEGEQYLASPFKIVQMLHDFPNIKKIFIMYNTTLSSTGPVERLFNQAKLIFQPRRNRLSAKNFERSLFIRQNGNSLLQSDARM